MDAVIRTVILYFLLLLLMRVSGRRTLAELTGFDFILLLVVAEVTDNMLLGQFSFVTGLLVIVTLFAVDIGLSILKQHSKSTAQWLDGNPVVVVNQGTLLLDRMNQMRVTREDVLEAARKLQGLERLDQIRYAVVESNGDISIIPKIERGANRFSREPAAQT
jgi:uncharacterized membrane protein YcaP (DUF421 family)